MVRIRFAEPGDAEESARAELLRQVSVCVAQLRECARARAKPTSRELQAALQALDPRLALTLVGDQENPRLCVTSRGVRELDGLVDLLCAKARDADVELQGYAPPLRMSEALAQVNRATGHNLEAARIRVGFGRGHLLEVSVHAACFPSANEHASLAAAERLVEAMLGDRIMDHWIRAVHCAPAPRSGPLAVLQDGPHASATLPLAELSLAVSAAIEGLVSGLPETPFSREQNGPGWTMFEAEPELASDYPAQDDVAVATTLAPEMLKCFLERAPFSSLRFSRHGETFAYLKIEIPGDSVARLAQRERLEDALGNALGPGLGCVIGNGLGIRYLYIDLALEDLVQAIPRLRASCVEHLDTPRAWLLFCDSGYAQEWVGMHPSAPPAPLLQSQARSRRRGAQD